MCLQNNWNNLLDSEETFDEVYSKVEGVSKGFGMPQVSCKSVQWLASYEEMFETDLKAGGYEWLTR